MKQLLLLKQAMNVRTKLTFWCWKLKETSVWEMLQRGLIPLKDTFHSQHLKGPNLKWSPQSPHKLSELGIVPRAEIPVPLKPRWKAPSTGHWPWSWVWNNRFQCTGWNARWLLALGHRQGGSTPVVEHRQNLFVLLCKTWVTHSISCLEKQFRRYY